MTVSRRSFFGLCGGAVVAAPAVTILPTIVESPLVRAEDKAKLLRLVPGGTKIVIEDDGTRYVRFPDGTRERVRWLKPDTPIATGWRFVGPEGPIRS